MALNQTTLRSILAQILSIDPKYIVPKQGNWFNPQDVAISPDKPDTWVSYRIDFGKPRNLPFLRNTSESKVASITWYLGGADIRFIGVRAEAMAQSVPHWIHRRDVKDAFSSIDAELMADDTSYRVDTYYQDGLSTTLAFRTRIKIMYASVIETTQQRWLPSGHSGLFIQ